MKDKTELVLDYLMDNTVSPFARKFVPSLSKVIDKERKKMFRVTFIDGPQVHEVMSQMILSSSPIMLGRLGNTERHILAEYLLKKQGLRKKYSKKWKKWLLSTSGYFISDEKADEEKEIDSLAELFLSAMSISDIEGLWYSDYEPYIINNFAKNAKVTHANNTLIYSNLDNSWGKALKNKKVLFISPFEETILKQYENKDKIWGDYHLLPNFKLLTIKSPYTAAGNFPNNKNWFDVYNSFKNQVLSLEFDIAILGCGIYGYPLAAEIKKGGRKALQMCGETQIIMGITGKRWEDGGYVDSFVNKYWTKPIDEKPKNYKRIEGGCYW